MSFASVILKYKLDVKMLTVFLQTTVNCRGRDFRSLSVTDRQMQWNTSPHHIRQWKRSLLWLST